MKITLALIFVVLTWAVPSLSLAETMPLETTTTVTERVMSDGTRYYSVEVSLPENVAMVFRAWLELRADVSARNLSGFVDPAPMCEVFALKRPLSGDPEESNFEATSLPMSRPVAIGSDRLVRIDVTEFVRRILADPSKNHGLVLGPLTNDKRGIFTIRQDSFGPSIAARLVVIL